jgi:pyrroline-5-carboxylate reductase
MAEAFIRGIIKGVVYDRRRINVSDVRRERCAHMETACAVHAYDSNTLCVQKSDVVVLAVKPQSLDAVLEEIAGPGLRGKLVISIVAGVRLGRIEDKLGNGTAVVRVMPNTPALVGEGVSVWTRGARVTGEDAVVVKRILGAVGREYEVRESLMDAATALSGSGPAYVFYLIEAMARAGVELGFDEKRAREIAAQTVAGAGALARSSEESPELLRKKVTSPGGTTEAAIRFMESAHMGETIVEAMRAACRRAQELSA